MSSKGGVGMHDGGVWGTRHTHIRQNVYRAYKISRISDDLSETTRGGHFKISHAKNGSRLNTGRNSDTCQKTRIL